MPTETEFASLIPHAGRMCLLDVVLAWDETTLHARTTSHALPGHPLRTARGLHAVHLAEYGAQAMAVHGALRDRAQGATGVKPGRLVSLRDVQLAVEHVDPQGGALDVHAECLYADGAGAQYVFRVEQGGRLLASGRAAVIHPAEPGHG